MHKKTCHILKANAARKMPKWVIFFDTETYEEIIDDKNKRLKLKLGYAILTRRDVHNEFRIISECVFYDAKTFHDWLNEKCCGRERYYLTAHNIAFDVRIVGLLDNLALNQWKRTLLIEEGINFIARYRRGDTTLRIVNNQQLFNTSLKLLGESIGTYKQQVDFSIVSNEDLLSYCKQDVEVMRAAWNMWVKFVRDNDLGNFQITAASQAMSSFRHRFMKTPIYIHDNEKCIELERESYHGGRVECFYIGKYDKGKVYCLDVNSMYPFVMKTEKVPTKLLKYYDRASKELFMGVRERFGYIVDATLTTTAPALPHVREGRLLFPTGNFRGVFTKPELEAAARYATVQDVHRLALYDEKIVFDQFVDFFYEARQKFKREGNVAFTYISKILLNSLYGKFAQRQLEYVQVGTTRTTADGYYVAAVPGRVGLCKIRIINGIVERSDGFREGFNSFVAIASYITASARVYLDALIEKAGRSNVLYCDTDSLFVTEEGFNNLQKYIDPIRLGKLKLEGVEELMTISAPKMYHFGAKSVSKGIRASAVQISERTFEQDKFMSFRGSLRAHESEGVIVSRITKTLSPHYRKGVVLPTGYVAPFHLAA